MSRGEPLPSLAGPTPNIWWEAALSGVSLSRSRFAITVSRLLSLVHQSQHSASEVKFDGAKNNDDQQRAAGIPENRVPAQACRAQSEMAQHDALVVTDGSNITYLTGYTAKSRNDPKG